jgi:hypothetical protein
VTTTRPGDEPAAGVKATQPSAPSGSVDIAGIKSMWPAVLEALKAASRVAWTAFEQSTPVSVAEGVLAVAMPDNGRITFARNGGHDERLRQALIDVLKVDVRAELMLDPGRAKATSASSSQAAEQGDAHEDDETVANRAGVDVVTGMLGGTVIETRDGGQ